MGGCVDSVCFRSWPERLEPSPAGRTRMFRENLSLPDSGWPRFVRMFDLSSAQGVGVATACSRSGPSWNRKRIFGPKTKGNLVSCPSESEGQETQVTIYPPGARTGGEAGATAGLSDLPKNYTKDIRTNFISAARVGMRFSPSA